MLDGTRRHHVRMAGKDEHGRRRAAACPQIGDVVRLYRFADKAQRREDIDQVLLAALVVGRDRGQGDQFFGQGEGFGGGHGRYVAERQLGVRPFGSDSSFTGVGLD
ncbi:hypothetical protein D3C72_2195980 [compost metagenome]